MAAPAPASKDAEEAAAGENGPKGSESDKKDKDNKGKGKGKKVGGGPQGPGQRDIAKMIVDMNNQKLPCLNIER